MSHRPGKLLKSSPLVSAAERRRRAMEMVAQAERLFVGRVCSLEKRLPCWREFARHFEHEVISDDHWLPQVWAWKGEVLVSLLLKRDESGDSAVHLV